MLDDLNSGLVLNILSIVWWSALSAALSPPSRLSLSVKSAKSNDPKESPNG